MKNFFGRQAFSRSPRRCAFLFFALVFTIALIGCAQINHLREDMRDLSQKLESVRAMMVESIKRAED